jgi:hypothetical protein
MAEGLPSEDSASLGLFRFGEQGKEEARIEQRANHVTEF